MSMLRVGGAAALCALCLHAVVPVQPAHAQTFEPFEIASVVPATSSKAALTGRLAATVQPLSPECRSVRPDFEGRSPFRNLRQALRERRAARVLAIGSSSIVGVGASAPSFTFPVRLEADLEGTFKGSDFDVMGRGMSGEVAEATAERLKEETLRTRPDLVVWQVGTNDGVHHADRARFARILAATLRWLVDNRVEVVLIDPQYVVKFAGDEHYQGIVKTVAEVARQERVPLVHRYDAMEDLAASRAGVSYMAGDAFHLNDLGYKCMSEFTARAIETGIMLADAEPVEPPT